MALSISYSSVLHIDLIRQRPIAPQLGYHPCRFKPSLACQFLGQPLTQTRLEKRGSIAASVVVTANYEDDEEYIRLSFLERLVKAWHILFPPKPCPPSAAEIGKERLRLVLYTDRVEVSQEVRRRLRENIVAAISTYVEIESEEDVQLSVSGDPDFGTVYSVTVPVRRVKPEYQEQWSDAGFRDRFYEEMLRGREDMGPSRLRVESKLLDEDEK